MLSRNNNSTRYAANLQTTQTPDSAIARVSIKFVNDVVLFKRATGSLEAKQQGNGGGHGKLAGVADRTPDQGKAVSVANL